MSKLIKIYGERNTNTNYMSRLIKLNLDIRELSGSVPASVMRLQDSFPEEELVRDVYFYLTYSRNLGWKHSCAKPMDALKRYAVARNNLYYLTITKNPYSWLLSLYRRPYHQCYPKKLDFEEFLKTPWRTVGRDNIGRTLKGPVELWNIKNFSYLQLAGSDTLNITTEDIFKDPEAVIDKVSSQFAVDRLSDDFTNYERSTKNESKDTHYYRDYYLNEKWRNKLSEEAISIINESVDKSLMGAFGYKVLS